MIVTGDDDVGVVAALLPALALSTSLVVVELSVLIGVYEYQPVERKDLKWKKTRTMR